MPERAAKPVAYHRRLKRTSRMGEKNTNQKPGVLASAAIAAIFGSGTFAPAISWGITKKILPLASPMVASERPNNHTGGTGRVTFNRASESCTYYYRSSRLRGTQVHVSNWDFSAEQLAQFLINALTGEVK